jgi:hypothetical protein
MSEQPPQDQWEVRAEIMQIKLESGFGPTSVPDGWEPFATTVAMTGKTRLWLRRRSTQAS